MRGKTKNNKNKRKYNPDEIIELLDGNIEMKDETGDKPNKRKLKNKKKTETNQNLNCAHTDKTIEMKDETKNEENKPYELSKEETENFQKAFKFYLLKENKQVEELVNDKIIIKKNSENEEQNLSDEIITNYKNKNESLGQIIDINELDIKGKPVFKKLEDGKIIYNSRVFILYPGISTNTKATFRCKFYRKDEKNCKKQGNQNFVKVQLYIIIHLMKQKRNIYSKLNILFHVIHYTPKVMKILYQLQMIGKNFHLKLMIY